MYPNHPNSNQSQQAHPSTTAGASTNDNHNHHHQHHQLTRYGSAPSSVFDSSDVVLSAETHSLQSNGVQKYGHSTAGFGIPSTGDGSNLTMSIARGVGSSSSSSNPMQPPPPNSSSLFRHSSSPPGFLQQLTADTGFTLTKGGQSYSNNSQATSSHGAHKQSRLGGSQLSFTNQVDRQPSLRRASSSHSASNGFSISQWENDDTLVFGGSSSKRGKNVSADLLRSLSAMDSQMELGEMGVVEDMTHNNIPEDSVACKVRAKRGFATHPRSIAERERRTRISGKLKKLQELVPNMDKQTSYSEMLDLAIQHITGLQFKIQELNKEVSSCTCGCKPNK